ncbi:hypothetical protein CHRY9390_02182 [Chryseobacterium aquaeductus]|uniref:Uncharacterized protein n=2 Tax=Chryseobacterium aquaeductus TaxID=2675056 RepID=A0A9N8QSH2_9FLAO|nr:hypothetical protein CHRY9390_02182 [Chryseobacterium potabilaquae]CAD7810459.1 hypothetical protein CHRY9390_02182 [Chryseobacterium aquaeductus]
MLSGVAVDFTGKVTHDVLQNGTYSSAIMQQDVLNCHLEISTYYTRCGESDDHHNGEKTGAEKGPCRSETPSVLVVSLVRKCTVALPVDTGLGENGEDGGNGPQNGPGGLSNNPPEETTTAPNLPTRNNPCNKTKAMLENQAVQTKIANLKQQAELPAVNPAGGEKGFKLKTDGTLEDATMTAKHEVDYGDLSDSYGAYHNHTLRGTHMLSHKDIDILLGLTTHNSVVGPGNAFHGMIAAEEDGSGGFNYLNYVVRFNGTYQDAIGFNFTDDQLNDIRKDHKKILEALKLNTLYSNDGGFTLNKEGLQKLFFEAAKLMGMQNNVILQRVDDDGVKTIQLNSDGSTRAVPCV